MLTLQIGNLGSNELPWLGRSVLFECSCLHKHVMPYMPELIVCSQQQLRVPKLNGLYTLFLLAAYDI